MEGYYWHKVALQRINGQSSKRSSRCGQGYDAMKAICLIFMRFRPLWNNFRAALLCPRPLTCHLNSDCETSRKLLKLQPPRTTLTGSVDDDTRMSTCSQFTTKCLTDEILIKILWLNLIYCCFVHLQFGAV